MESWTTGAPFGSYVCHILTVLISNDAVGDDASCDCASRSGLPDDRGLGLSVAALVSSVRAQEP